MIETQKNGRIKKVKSIDGIICDVKKFFSADHAILLKETIQEKEQGTSGGSGGSASYNIAACVGYWENKSTGKRKGQVKNTSSTASKRQKTLKSTANVQDLEKQLKELNTKFTKQEKQLKQYVLAEQQRKKTEEYVPCPARWTAS